MTELADAVAAVSKLIANYGLTRDETADLLSGTADGGPGGDGLYPVTLADGSTRIMVPSPQKLAEMNRAPGAGSIASEQITSDPDELLSLRAKLGVVGTVTTLATDVVLASFEPRPGDAFNLNGHTLTIERMADTPLTNLFRGAGKVRLLGGIARPEWWETTSYRAAAIALMAGGSGTVMLSPARYPSEGSGANPLPIAGVRFAGAGMPDERQGLAGLADNGTVLEGPVVFASQAADGSRLGHNVAIENLGVDSGALVVGDATGVEGLVFPNIGPGGQPNAGVELRSGIVIRNVRTLVKASDDDGHGILVESAINPLIEGCRTRFGKVGVVLKTRGGIVRGCQMSGHSVAPGLAKSDAYSICTDTVWEACLASSTTGADTGPFRIQAATAHTSRHTFRDLQVSGTTQWISIESQGANNVTDVTITGGGSEGTRFGSIVISRINANETGVIQRVTLISPRINNVLERINGAEYIGHGIYIGAAADTVNISAAQIYGTAWDGVRSYAQNVMVTGSTALAPGQVVTNPATPSYGFNAVGGTMKVPASGNNGTTNGNVAV